MNKREPAPRGQAEIELPGTINPVLAVLGFLPLMTIIMIALALAVEQTPMPLMILLLLVAGCCAMLSFTALQVLLGGKLTFDDEGLTVHRFLSEQRFPWPSIEGCKVMLATGTFGDDALAEIDNRTGLGLFIRGLDRVREHDLDADIVLCAGSKDRLQPLMQIASKVDAAAKRGQVPGRQVVGRSTPAPGRAPQSGQRRPVRQRPAGARKPDAAKVDPVAAFRNR